MTKLNAQEIRDKRMISPFCERTRQDGVTYGLSSGGYDVRAEFDRDGFLEEMFIYPDQFVLISTIEKFSMPRDVIGTVFNKSTWARRGLVVMTTVIEPGWDGWLTLELKNHGQQTIRLTRGVGIAQILFDWFNQPTDLPYEGKYQNQERGPVSAKNDA